MREREGDSNDLQLSCRASIKDMPTVQKADNQSDRVAAGELGRKSRLKRRVSHRVSSLSFGAHTQHSGDSMQIVFSASAMAYRFKNK